MPSGLSRQDELKLQAKTQQSTRNAIASGVLVKQPCARCGTKKQIVPHHVDYTDHLKIVWLCKTHHSQFHGIVSSMDRRVSPRFQYERLVRLTDFMHNFVEEMRWEFRWKAKREAEK